MVTRLVGTDGVSASETIRDYLEGNVDDGDHLEVVNVLTSDDPDERHAGDEALELFEDVFEGVSVTTNQFHRDRKPADELVKHADEVDADQIVVALRRHSRTERIIFGSVSHSLLRTVTRPITLVPLAEYQPPEE